MRGYIQNILRDLYVVVTAADGAEAFEAARKNPPDLILSDIMMPVMNGIELLKAVRSDEALGTIPVILLSARAGDEEKSGGIDLGADDYLTKPFSVQELQARVRTQLALADMRAKLLRELAISNRELESFSYSVAHDLRAPLRSIIGFSEMALEDYGSEIPAAAKEHLRKVTNSAAKMGILIDGLLNLSRVTRREIVKRSINLSAIATDLLAALQAKNPERKVVSEIAPDVIVQGDPTLLEAVLTNLIGNAWKFTRHKDPATIEFGVQHDGGRQLYFVRDNGAGFNMKHANKLFGAFQRLHSDKEFEGTGVGLATCQRIIHRHGGIIWGEGELDRGATFFFTLP